MNTSSVVQECFYEAERNEIDSIKELGFEMIRAHKETGTINITQVSDGTFVTATVFVPKK